MTMLEQKGDVRIISDTRTLKGTARGVWRSDAGGLPVCAPGIHPQKSQYLPGAGPCHCSRPEVAANGLGPGDIIKAVPESYFLDDRALYLASFSKVRESISLDGIIPEDGPRTALKALASCDASIKPDSIDLAKTYTNNFAQRAKERFKA